MSVTTGEEKAALVLKSLPLEMAETVLAKLDEERRERLRAQMARLPEPEETDSEFDHVLAEFSVMMHASGWTTTEAAPPTHALSAYSHASAVTSTEGRASPVTEKPAEKDPLAPLAQVNLDKLALAMSGEQPRTVAVLLVSLGSSRAGEILKRLQPDHRKAVSVLLGQVARPPKDLLERITSSLLEKARQLGDEEKPLTSEEKYKNLADTLRMLPKIDRLDVLAAIDEGDPETSARIKGYLYQFEDILLIQDRSIQKLLSELDAKTLGQALRGASEPIKDKLLNNLSNRARESLSEEMEFMGTLTGSQIQEAQKAVVEVIQRLDQAGELEMIEE